MWSDLVCEILPMAHAFFWVLQTIAQWKALWGKCGERVSALLFLVWLEWFTEVRVVQLFEKLWCGTSFPFSAFLLGCATYCWVYPAFMDRLWRNNNSAPVKTGIKLCLYEYLSRLWKSPTYFSDLDSQNIQSHCHISGGSLKIKKKIRTKSIVISRL